jgi:DNA-binding GntR family transcriptional regulator
MTAIDANSITPLYRQLTELLRGQIASGALADGARLPSEAQLGEQYGVSRITIRQALADLERQGLLERAPGKGTFVRRRPRPIEGLTRLSGFSENAAAAGLEAGYLVLSAGERAVGPDVAERLALPAACAYVVERVLLANGAPVGMHASAIPLTVAARVRPGALSREHLGHGSLYAAIESAGVTLLRAVETLEPGYAGDEQGGHLGIEPTALVQRVRRTVFDAEGRQVIFEADTYRPDAFTYRVELYRGREPAP